VFGYKGTISLQEALVIGSIISTTDPVAVVALLKELGTSIKFNTLLEGESLLNDGTAYVIFLICIDVVVEGEFDLWPSMLKFFRMSFGGPLFGIIIAYLCCNWLEVILKDNTLIVMITVFSAYLIFFISETYLVVSGILALFGFGIYLGTHGKV
jgi:NhaP-type Na+/H+ or K+/H+ antiporter